MFGLYGVLLRLLFSGVRGRSSETMVQGIGLLIAGVVVAVGSIFVLSPILMASLYWLVLDALLVIALLAGGAVRLLVGLFSIGSTSEETRHGPAVSPVNYYVALPEEMPVGYCWQCGKRVKPDSLICLRCGATQTKGVAQRPMISAPTFERGAESGAWPQWQGEGESASQPAPAGPGGFRGGAPYRPGAPYAPQGQFPGDVAYPPQRMPYPPQQMPYPPGPGYPGFPPPQPQQQRGRRQRGAPFPGWPNPGAPFPAGQQPGRGRLPRIMKRSRPRDER